MPNLVAVISSGADLRRAAQMRPAPNFFEIRLDAMFPVPAEVDRTIPKLVAPVIITARHPVEGGMNKLSPSRRRSLLLRFLPYARYVDVELRSVARLKTVLNAAGALNSKRIISVHELRRTPTVHRLGELARSGCGGIRGYL